MTNRIKVEGQRTVSSPQSAVAVDPGRALNIETNGARVVPRFDSLTVALGRRVRINRSSGETVTISFGVGGGGTVDDDVTFARDGDGRILTATFDHGEVWTYDYTSGQLDEVTTNRSTDPVVTYTRDGNGRIQRIDYGGND